MVLCADEEVCVERWVGHRLYPPPREGEVGGKEEGGKEGEEGEVTRFWLWGEETHEAYQLDTVFFQNWYGYQDEVVTSGSGMDLMQVLCVRVSLSLFSILRLGVYFWGFWEGRGGGWFLVVPGFSTLAIRNLCGPETDVRCRRVVSVPAVVGAVWAHPVAGCGRGAGEVGRWDDGVSAVL